VKEILKQYASYNVWAHQQLINTITALPEELQLLQVASSFNGLKPTLQHMWNAEYIWYHRVKLAENIQSPAYDEMDLAAVADGIIKQSRQWEEWVMNASENVIQHVFAYRNSKKEEFKQPVYQVLLHLFNHNTYHRGQLVTILHHSGIQAIPATDFIEFSRRKR
jgi:uncharacterized damage-inducible protein DinB